MIKEKEVKEVTKKEDATDLWNKMVEPIPIARYAKETADTEKTILFSETGAGKTRFYLKVLEYLQSKGLKKEDLYMSIIFPDRPSGLVKLYGLVPKEYQNCIDVFPVGTYEELIIATATTVRKMEEHRKKTGKFGWMIFELMENYWTFSMDYYCRKAYGETMADYFTQMQSIAGKDRAEKKSSFESFAGPFGGPWPTIKFHHNFNWIDKLKRMPYNMIFTSELREEDNKDSIFSQLGYRPAGEKHTQHKVDVILYLKHDGNNFFMKPFKLTGYEKIYGELNITKKNGYQVHKEALKKLEQMGHKVSKIDDIEQQAGITPPETKEKTIKTISKGENGEEVEGEITKKELITPAEKEEEEDDFKMD